MREGLTCVVSVKVPNPEFEGQTKVLLYYTFTRSAYSLASLGYLDYCSFHHLIYFSAFHITLISLLYEDKVGKSRGSESG